MIKLHPKAKINSGKLITFQSHICFGLMIFNYTKTIWQKNRWGNHLKCKWMEKGIPIFFYKNAVGATFNAMVFMVVNQNKQWHAAIYLKIHSSLHEVLLLSRVVPLVHLDVEPHFIQCWLSLRSEGNTLTPVARKSLSWVGYGELALTSTSFSFFITSDSFPLSLPVGWVILVRIHPLALELDFLLFPCL